MVVIWSLRLGAMGIHHFTIIPLPRAQMQHHLSVGNSIASLEDLEWLPEQEAQPSEVFLSRLRGLFPNDTSWGSVEEYESDNEWGSDLRILHTGEPRMEHPVDGIVFRYSPTGDPVQTLEVFVAAAEQENCLLFSRELCTWFEPELNIVCDKLEMSRAFRFTQDPSRALTELEAKQDDP